MTRTEAKRLKLTKTLEEAHEMADRYLSNARSANRRKTERPPRYQGKTKQQRREERRQRTENVRVEVFNRDGGRCVICGDEATDMHHLVYGSGMRRVLESGKTCAALCRAHHEQAHRGHPYTMEALRLWARGNGYTLAADAITRRLDRMAALAARPVREGETTP